VDNLKTEKGVSIPTINPTQNKTVQKYIQNVRNGQYAQHISQLYFLPVGPGFDNMLQQVNSLLLQRLFNSLRQKSLQGTW
jgi:hypothetical protein